MAVHRSIPQPFILLFLALAALSSCTSARWTVKDKSALDREEYRVLGSEEFLEMAAPATPENPTLNLQVKSKNTYEFSQKVLAQRTIQDYKLKPGFMILGLLGGGLAAYAANSKTFSDGQSSAASLSLNIAALLMASSGFMNMKPVGEPRPTGEERFLRSTGAMTEVDTLSVNNTEGETAAVSIWYGNLNLIDSEERLITDGELNITLGNLLGSQDIRGEELQNVRVQIQYNDSTYNYSYGLDQVLLPYARVITPVTELRSSPENVEDNILAELVEGSQLEIVGNISSEWYKILYGISENYITQQDAEVIWRPSGFSENSEVVAVPVVPFGNIDVENNIPILSGINSNAFGLIVTNENYQRPHAARSHANRDGQLIQAYLENALGFRARNVNRLEDIQKLDMIKEQVDEIRRQANDSSQVVIYLSGYGLVSRGDNDNRFQISYLPVAAQSDTVAPGAMNLSELFRLFGNIPSDNLLVIADIDFKIQVEPSSISEEQLDISQPLRTVSEVLTENKPNAAVLFGSQLNQHSELYVGDRSEDKKHHLLPYFFAKSLQERNTGLEEIYQYLQRNIPYTARRLHDRSQDPQLIGNSSLQLIPTE